MEAVQPNIPIYSGEFHHVLDEKNRLTIPARWRQTQEGEEFYVLPNPTYPCLTVMLAPVLQKIGSDSAQHAGSQHHHRIFLRNLYSQVRNCATDRQGRLLLPDDHCKRVNLSGPVVLVGSFDRFEIWNEDEWQQTRSTGASTFEEVARLVGI